MLHPEVEVTGGGNKQKNAINGLLGLPLGCRRRAAEWNKQLVSKLRAASGGIRGNLLDSLFRKRSEFYCQDLRIRSFRRALR